MNDRFRITPRGEALIESGLSLRQAHELETSCTTANYCDECRRSMGPSWVALGRPRLAAVAENPTPEAEAELVRFAVENLAHILDTIEALYSREMHTRKGWVVGAPTTEGWQFLRSYDRAELMRAGAEHDLAAALESDGPGSGWQLLEVREVSE